MYIPCETKFIEGLNYSLYTANIKGLVHTYIHTQIIFAI